MRTGNAITGASNLPTLLTDPGNVWAADHLYAEGDLICPLGDVVYSSVGHTSGSVEPTWPSSDPAMSLGVADGDGGWNVAGFVGKLPAALVGAGLGLQRQTGPSVIPLTTPSLQDVIDALVSLALIVQED